MADIFAQRTDYVEDAQLALTDQFRRDVIQKLAATFGQQVQDLEDVIFQLLSGRTVDTAVGAQLDGLGAVVGEARLGAADARYRVRIKARIKLNVSSGTAEQILELVVLLLPPSVTPPRIKEYFPASFILTAYEALTSTEAEEIGRTVQLAKPGGVGARFVYGYVGDAARFRMAPAASSVTDSTRGFSDLSQITGGKLAGVVTNG